MGEEGHEWGVNQLLISFNFLKMVVTSNQVYNVFRSYFRGLIPDSIFNDITIISDTSYQTIDGVWLRDMVLNDAILAPLRYRRDIFDCDDYVLYLKAKIGLYAANTESITRPLAVGYILTKQHAFNFGIDNNGHLFILNTQSENRSILNPASAEECAFFLQISNINPIKNVYI